MKKISVPTGNLLCLLVLIFAIGFCQEEFIDPIPLQSVQRPTLVEANHYYSNKDRSVNYNVVSLKKNLPVFIIPKHQKRERTTYTNRINVTLNDNKGNYISCLFQDNYQLCVLDKFNAETLTMIIQCDSLPCEFSWDMLQTPMEKINTTNVQKSSLKQLYEVKQSQQNRHLTIKVSCDSPQFNQEFHKHLQFYANKQNYHRLKTQGLTYFLFKNPPTSFKEYFYIRINQKYRQCAQIQIYNQQSDVKTNNVINDFALAGQSVSYDLTSHSTHMRMDANIHFFNKSQTLSGIFNVKLLGSIGGISQTIRSMTLHPKKKKNIQFSFVLNNITEHYTNLSLSIQSSQLDCLLKFQLIEGEVQLVEKGQFSFVSIKRGEQVKYKIIQDKDAAKNDKVYIFASQEQKVRLSQRQCEAKTGCNFELVALQDFDGSIYLGQSITEDTEEIVKFSIDRSFTKRVHEDTTVYLKKELDQRKNYQVVVNTHNVILYAASEEKCKVPSEKCHQKVGNSHNPFIYQSDHKSTLIIAVHSLDESQFTVNIIEQNGEYPELRDGIPFTYLMDDNQEDVIFKFNLDQKQDLTFNVIAPFNQLGLYVFQTNKHPQDYQKNTQLYSVDGYIVIKKTKITSKQFIVIVRKLDPKKAKFVHFTLIASTKNTNIKLQTGVTHHQKLTPTQHQDFVLEFDSSKKYVVSFYLHDSVGQKVNLSLQLSKNDTYINQKGFFFQIDQQVDQIDITEEGKKVCEMKGTTSCEIFFRLTNKMKKDANMQLTLLSTNSIVELQDGTWQYFPQQLTSTTTNFYFLPKHLANPINIFYQSNNPDMRLLYGLKKIDSDSLNPEEWQFPNMNKQENRKQGLNLAMRQVKHISIGKQALSVCFPNCLLLITLVKSQQVKGRFNEMARNKNFGILVSNNIIDVPQKTRLDVSIQKGESKYMKMSMKNVFQHDTLTAYVYTSLGFVSVYGNACSSKNLRMPSKEEFDFSFGILQTQLRSETIKKKFEENEIDEDENPYLCLVAVSDESSKFSIEYTSEQQIVSLLRLDEFKTVGLEKGETKYFQIEGSVENRIKVVRNKGFPFIDQVKCTGKDASYQECFEQFQESQKSAKSQIIQKVKRYQYEPCQKCIIYLKISSQQPAEIDLHLESKYAQITLQQNRITTDFVQNAQENKYELTSLSNQATFITLNVLQGNILCRVTDLNTINIEKKSDSKQRTLHFPITPAQFQGSKSGLGGKKFDNPFDTFFSGFGLQKLFTTLHISVQSVDQSKGASYTISYSSGERESYLQDGLVSSYKLQGNTPKSVAKFYYENQDMNSHVYIFLGAKKSSQLSKLEINIYQMQSQDDQDSKREINSRIPEIRKKTQKPTVMYPLPTAKFYSIEISNPTGSEIELSIGVNHQQVLFLPFEMDYPFPLANSQSVNFILDIKNKGYVLLALKKCDQSQGEISYTFDYEGFLKNEYQFTSSLNTDPKFQYLIKVKNPGPLYINIKRNQVDSYNFGTQLHNSVFSLNARFSFQKMKTSDFMKPGNNGLLTYEIQPNNKVKIQFDQVTCSAQNQQFCTDKFQYFLIASDQMLDVYTQSVCPSTYFAQLQNSQKRKVLPLRKILEKAHNHKISVEYQFQKDSPISYLAVKGVYKNKEDETVQVYYRLIQVASLWGQVQKVSSRFGIHIAVILGFLFCVFLICLRRQKRKGYQSLEQYD